MTFKTSNTSVTCDRAVQIPSSRPPWRLNSLLWCQLFVGRQYETWLNVSILAPRFKRCLLHCRRNCAPLAKSQNIVIGIVSRLRAGQQWNLGSVPDRGSVLSLIKSAQTGSGFLQPSYSTGTGDILPGVEWPKCETYHSLHKVAQWRTDGTVWQD